MPQVLLKPALPGIALRRWRQLHRIKQDHAAQLFNVTQSTISRWESGVLAIDPAAHLQLEQLLAARSTRLPIKPWPGWSATARGQCIWSAT